MGKTSFLSVFAEELARNHLRFSVLDPVGVSWGLQHGATKDKPGLPVLILGGLHGDIPIEPTAGAVVADLVTDEAVSTVIDISRHPNGKMWSNSEQIRFVADYAERLYERQGERRVPLMQIIDETGRFCPQNWPHGAVDIARCVGAIERLVEWGRNVGVGVCLVTQRSARMNKSVSELADCMIAFRTVGPRSVDSILDWLGEHIEKARHKTLLENLRKLDVGTALVVSPGWLKHEGLVRMRKRETFDSSKTPEPGKRLAAPGKAAKPDLAKYRERMAATIEKAKADDPKELRERIRFLQKQLHDPKRATAPNDELKAENAKLLARGNKLADEKAQLIELAAELIEGIGNVLGPAEQTLMLLRKGAMPTRASIAKAVPPPEAPRAAPAKAPPAKPADRARSSLPGPEQRVLDAVAWMESIGVPHPEAAPVAFVAGYSVTSSAFERPRGQLRTQGLIEFPQKGTMALTEAGRKLANVPASPATTAELHERVLGLLPGPETKLLKPLLAAYPASLSNGELADEAGYSVSSSAFERPRGRLRTLGLIDFSSPGQLRARDILFPEGAQ
jgi:hypothetical protein